MSDLDQWLEKVPKLFEGVHDKLKCAQLLENQRVYNQKIYQTPAIHARISIPLLRRVFTAAMENNRVTIAEDTSKCTESYVIPVPYIDWLDYTNKIDGEAEMVCIMHGSVAAFLDSHLDKKIEIGYIDENWNLKYRFVD